MCCKAQGQLTTKLQIDQADYPLAKSLLPVLRGKVGRVLVKGWPRVSRSRPRWCTEGLIRRLQTGARLQWGRLQSSGSCGRVLSGLPDALLPEESRDLDSLRFWRMTDGDYRRNERSHSRLRQLSG